MENEDGDIGVERAERPFAYIPPSRRKSRNERGGDSNAATADERRGSRAERRTQSASERNEREAASMMGSAVCIPGIHILYHFSHR